MFLRGMAIDAYIIVNGDNAGETVCYLVHAHLKDVLGLLWAKRHVRELVPATMCVKSGQVGRLLVEVDAPEAVLSVQCTEACSTIEPMRNLLEGWGPVVLSNNGLVQVLWVEVDTKGTITILGISVGRHPLGRLGDRHYHPLSDHVINSALYLLSVLYGYLPLGMLDWG